MQKRKVNVCSLSSPLEKMGGDGIASWDSLHLQKMEMLEGGGSFGKNSHVKIWKSVGLENNLHGMKFQTP